MMTFEETKKGKYLEDLKKFTKSSYENSMQTFDLAEDLLKSDNLSVDTKQQIWDLFEKYRQTQMDLIRVLTNGIDVI